MAIVIASLACSRAAVPAPGGTGSGGLPITPSVTTTPRADTDTEAPAPSPTPTATAAVLLPPATPTFPPTPSLAVGEEPQTLVYQALPGDTLPAVAVRFGVIPSDITSTGPLPADGSFVDPGTVLLIPRRLDGTGPNTRLLPDSEVVFAPHAADFDLAAFAAEQGGYLNRYQEYVSGKLRTGPEVVAIVARDNSINPRLLLALLEYRSGWLTNPATPAGNALRYPLGYIDPASPNLHRQLTLLANDLGVGYYGWRAGSLTSLAFPDGTSLRLAPDLNAGTVALQWTFARAANRAAWEQALEDFISLYRRLFGDPWDRDYPIFIPGVRQPELALPWLPGHVWAFTGGPHGAWEREAAWAALDFAPSAGDPGCAVSDDWAVAAAPGLVVRSEDGVVALDLDGDGREQTGWVLIYLHLAERDRVPVGAFVEEGDRLGHPSCEGGTATGSHVHLVRKYNGEWILADGPLPFTLGGWVAHAGSKPYEGWLSRGSEVVIACTCASQETHIRR